MCHYKYTNGKVFITLLMIMMTSCSVLEKPDFTADNSLYRELDTSDTVNMAEVPWREMFTDTYLQNIIERAINNNPDVQTAMARMQKAAAAFRQSGAELFPSLNTGISAAYQSKNEGFGLPESYQVYGSTSWEADIWGKYRSSKRAARAALIASEAFRRAVITDLVSSVASNYYTLLALDKQLSITEQTLDRRIRNVEVMEVMKQNDVITGADLVLSQANRYSAEVTIPDLKQRIYETENTLSLLMGENPGNIERGSFDDQDLSPELKTGIPAQLLSNRPDVIEAEFRLRSFYEMTKVARRNFYPSLNITGRTGYTETGLSALFNNPVFFWNITGTILQPVFNYGLNRQRFISAKADFFESQAAFRKTLLNAGAEVANSFHAYRAASDKITLRNSQIGYLEKAVEYTNELLRYTSNTSYIDVLTSEVNLLSAQLAGVNDRLQQLQSVVDLYRSLGGGWR
ncbi:MAG TPA: efflux transporter outer membrane subunit [Bacteroidales bacterium]|nr:efflux transporter outer membrane subunit [Bacteroidales bacterium]